MEPAKRQTVGSAILETLVFVSCMLLPLKFGSIAAMPEIPAFYPDCWTGYLQVTFPAHSFGILSGTLLLVAAVRMLFCGKPVPSGRFMAVSLLFGVGLPVLTSIGCVSTQIPYIARYYLNHFCGAGCLALALWLAAGDIDDFGSTVCGGLGTGALAVSLLGLQQYFVGFAATRAFVARQMQSGAVISEAVLAKLADGRVFATMTSANVLAGFLLLAGPAAVAWAYGRGRNKRERIAICTAVVIPIVATFLLTRTRGAFLAAVVAAAIWAVCSLKSKIARVSVVATAIAVVIAGGVWIHLRGRGFSSAAERVDYWRTVAVMVSEKPVSGHGWGGFFTRHMMLKTTSSDEAARDPHNLVLSFAGQCGIPAGIAVLAGLVWMLAMVWKNRRTSHVHAAAAVGLLAFVLHGMTEVDHMTSAGLAGAMALALSAMPRDGKSKLNRPVLAALAICGVSVAIWSIGMVRADMAFYDFCEAVSPQSSERPVQARPEYVATKFMECSALKDDEPFADETYGSYLLSRGDIDNAERHFLKALALDPTRPGSYYSMALVEKRRNHPDTAEGYRQEAVRRFPANAKEYKFIPGRR
ncbi:MAG: O-antigen ligase family protein [Victivallaceae bacterium]|nr:O-antigen ligase family protein [Victivallaceae bacterium]